ncbi:MAG TPA: GDP-mannose 4,6-dehydratase [Byssovorax sp.]|jgi:GDPmannose 4,6-dehydratase
MPKRALVTGVAGQDGSYLAELLLAKGYEVIGTVRDVARDEPAMQPTLRGRVRLRGGSDISQEGWDRLVREERPDEIYNLSGVSFVPAAANRPSRAAEEIALPAIRMLEAVRDHAPSTRVYQACSSEMFGSAGPWPQSEETPIRPTSPYGAAKAYTYFAIEQFRALFGVFAVAGIAFNHESPRRPERFVSRRITLGAARIKLGLATTLELGQLDARRDWGYAKDYVDAMWRSLQAPRADSYVLATGVLRTVRDVAAIAFGELGLDYEAHVRVDPTLVRPDEARPLVGDSTRARAALGLTQSLSFEDLVREMVRADVAALASASRA